MKKLFEEFPYIENERIVLKRLEITDKDAVQALFMNENVYRYEPTFLPERKNKDAVFFISSVCEKLFKEKTSLVLGIYLKDTQNKFCGIAEIYHYDNRQVTVGYRLDEPFWGKKIATEVVALIKKYLLECTDINKICASNIVSNPASGRVLEKNGFYIVAENAKEDWGFEQEVIVNKWCCKQ